MITSGLVLTWSEVIKNSDSTQLSRKILLLKTFMSSKNVIPGLSEPEKKLNCLISLYLWAFKILCSAELSMNFLNNPGAWTI